eukprot:UC4_evm1s1363
MVHVILVVSVPCDPNGIVPEHKHGKPEVPSPSSSSPTVVFSSVFGPCSASQIPSGGITTSYPNLKFVTKSASAGMPISEPTPTVIPVPVSSFSAEHTMNTSGVLNVSLINTAQHQRSLLPQTDCGATSDVEGRAERLLRAKSLNAVAKRVSSEIMFQLQVTNFSKSKLISGQKSDAKNKAKTKATDGKAKSAGTRVPLGSGVFRLAADDDGGEELMTGNGFGKDKIVLWEHTGACASVFVCDRDENMLQAQAELSRFHNFVCEKNRNAPMVPTDITMKPEILHDYIHRFLPNGQVVLVNSNHIAELRKGLD